MSATLLSGLNLISRRQVCLQKAKVCSYQVVCVLSEHTEANNIMRKGSRNSFSEESLTPRC